MNTNLAELLRLNGYKFNILFGMFSLLGLPFIASNINLDIPGGIVGIGAIAIYVTEARAFNYKTRLTRVRILYDRTGGDPGKPGVSLKRLNWMMSYAFLIRMCFRIVLIMIALKTLHLVGEGKNIRVFPTLILVAAGSFEIFHLAFSTYGNRLESEPAEWKAEISWREKYFPMLNDPKMPLKEMRADIVLLVYSIVFNFAFWTLTNREFMHWIDDSHQAGDSGFGIFMGILVFHVVVCLFMLIPVRLAYWVGEYLQAIEPAQRRRLRWSFVFAAFSAAAPVLVHFTSVYVL